VVYVMGSMKVSGYTNNLEWIINSRTQPIICYTLDLTCSIRVSKAQQIISIYVYKSQH